MKLQRRIAVRDEGELSSILAREVQGDLTRHELPMGFASEWSTPA